MIPLLIGGDFGNAPKSSTVIDKIAENFAASTVINGGSIEDLENIRVSSYDFIFWAPNISNWEHKKYPTKDTGAVLIITKVVRQREIDSSSPKAEGLDRLFKMHANAVVLIQKVDKLFEFELVDALGNTWGVKTTDIAQLSKCMKELYEWTKSSQRRGLHKNNTLERLVQANRMVADKCEETTVRFFGNCSTRCMKLFPSTRITQLNDSIIWVSRRNVDKNRLETDDMVLVSQHEYYGEHKPSVDTPVQLELYKFFPMINFFIHGHLYAEGRKMTEEYFPCGDLREVPGILKIIEEDDIHVNTGIINLKNHGFLIYADTIDDLEYVCWQITSNKIKMINRITHF